METDFQYDDNGSLIGRGGPAPATWTHTPTRLVETVTVNGATTTYGYDADDLRTLKTDETSTRYVLHGLGSQVLAEFVDLGGVPVWTVEYLYLGTRPLGALRQQGAGVVALAPTLTVAEGGVEVRVTVEVLTGG